MELKEAKISDIVKYVDGFKANRPDLRRSSSMFRYRLERMLGVWVDYNPATKKYKLRDIVIGPGRLLVTTPSGVFKLSSGTTIVTQLPDGRYEVEYLDNLK